MKRFFWIWTMFAVMVPALCVAGDEPKKAQAEETWVTVKGTSTLHDWTVVGDTINGRLDARDDAPTFDFLKRIPGTETQDIRATLLVEIPALSLKSGKDGMDKKMYKALKTKDHSAIVYRLNEAIWIQDEPILLKTVGELTVAGGSRELEMIVQVEPLGDEQLKISGETKMKMTDFHIKPPKAMLGIIQTGDDIEVAFEWVIDLAAWKTELAGLPQ